MQKKVPTIATNTDHFYGYPRGSLDFSSEPEPEKPNSRLKRIIIGLKDTIAKSKSITADASEFPTYPVRYPFHSDFEYDLRVDDYYEHLEKVEKQRAERKTRKRIVGGIVALGISTSAVATVAKTMFDDEPKNKDRVEYPAAHDSPLPSDAEEVAVSVIDKLRSQDPVTLHIQTSSSAVLENQLDANPANSMDVDMLECYSEDVSIPLVPQFEQLKAVLSIDFALSTERYEQISKEIDLATDIETVKKITVRIFQEKNINLTFGPDPNDIDLDDAPLDLSLEDYKNGTREYIRALTYLPDELFNLGQLHELVIAPYDLKRLDSSNVLGTHYSGQGKSLTVVELYPSDSYTLIHEWGHGLHDAACPDNASMYGVKDHELYNAYLDANKVLEQDPLYNELRLKVEAYIAGDESALDYEEYQEFMLLLDLNGFPTDYSRTSEDELFAEVFTYLTKHGYRPLEETTTPRAKARAIIIEATLGRMQALMPQTDVSAWAQYVAVYFGKGFTPDIVSPKELLEAEASPLDASFIQDPREVVYSDDQVSAASLQPLARNKAIKVTDGNSEQYVYASYDEVNSRVYVYIKTELGENAPEDVDRAVNQYLSSLNPNESIKRIYGENGVVYYI